MISIVDNDESVHTSTKTLLRSAGYDVQSFASAHDFLNSGAPGETECLILDVRMPDTDGFELQRQLRAQGYRIPTIFVTAYDDDFIRRRAMESGAIDILHKPFDAALFLATVEKALSDSADGHISNKRLRKLAAPSLAETGSIEVASLLTPEESAHFRGCSDCIDGLANIVRTIIRGREKKNAASDLG